ncbi:autoinducer binding domain-containing protein [Rhodoblastus acidophilus]|uniref:Autoinducer binding domain-containing protein n=1 Tax=Candidatus Rhodoblastus alkanivorans TaxID=2954117 RepID=A0ABS9Z2R0_9HYPH|nr:autoinducer binding domain-containing protein [Candidatus Rhodoblastus alkanivorans]MCI4680598.1 autoinducer binding domain-containing protein [Candidatus Rhodoblastus alkanivorans]MCI4681756.1 autoinducer binding domain-containing protein [Candidatus Rhodoblastus alkanivorans]
MDKNFDKTWRFIESIERSSDAAEVERSLLKIAVQYGFNSVFAGIVPTTRVSPDEIASRILFQRFPSEWAGRYHDRGFVFRDPIVRRLQSDRAPFDWDEAYSSCPAADDVALIKGEAAEFGLRDGYVVPVPTLDGSLAAVSFGGPDAAVDAEGRALLGFAASYAVGAFLHHRESRRRLLGKVTPREFDCLLWAAEGKTDWEIAVILGISKPTVVKHLLSAREKLGAVTKGHAIAIALRMKLLR